MLVVYHIYGTFAIINRPNTDKFDIIMEIKSQGVQINDKGDIRYDKGQHNARTKR